MEPDAYQEAMRDVMATPESVQGILLVAGIMVISMLSAIGAVFSFLFTMTFFRVPEEHRRMKLGRVWLIMVPVFGVAWLFFTVRALAKSFRSYFHEAARDDPDAEIPSGDFGLRLGALMALFAALAHASALLVYTKSSLYVGIGVGLLAAGVLVLAALYFAKVFRIRKRIPDPELEIVPESYL